MAEGGTQYDLRLGLDTGPAQPKVAALAQALVQTGAIADGVQQKLDSVSLASGRLGAGARQGATGITSIATASQTVSSSLAGASSSIASASAAASGLGGVATKTGASLAGASAGAMDLSLASKELAADLTMVDAALAEMAAGVAGVTVGLSASANAFAIDLAVMRQHREATLEQAVASGSLAAALDKEMLALQPNLKGQRELMQAKRTFDDALGAGLINQRQHTELLELARQRYEKLTPEVTKNTTATGAWRGMLVGAVATLALLTFGKVIGEVKQFATESVQAAMVMQRADSTLRSATGSQKEATSAVSFLRKESERLGLVFEDQIGQFAQISAAARGTALEGEGVRQVYLSIAEAGTVYKLSADQMGGAMMALQQMISKGTVQAEELRGQLGERLPGAFGIAARAMGVTTAQLGKMLEQGEVISSEFLPKFAAQLRKEMAGEVDNASMQAAASFNRLENSTFQLKAAIGEGLLPAMAALSIPLKDFVQSIIDAGVAEDLAAILKLVTDQARLMGDSFESLGLKSSDVSNAIIGAATGLGTLKTGLEVLHPIIQDTASVLAMISQWMDRISGKGDATAEAIGKATGKQFDPKQHVGASIEGDGPAKPGVDPFANEEAAWAKWAQEQSKALGEVTVRSGQATAAAQTLYAAHQAGYPAVAAANREIAIQEARLPLLMKGQYDAANAAGAAAAAQFDLDAKTKLLTDRQDMAVASAQAMAGAEARAKDALAGNALASQRAARETEILAFRKRNLLGENDKLVASMRTELEARDASLNASEREAEAADRDLQYSTDLAAAEAELADARTGGVKAQREAAKLAEIEGRLRKDGLIDAESGLILDEKKAQAIIDEVTLRRQAIDTTKDQARAEEQLREMRDDTRGMQRMLAIRKDEYGSIEAYEKALRRANTELAVEAMRKAELANETNPEIIDQMEREIRLQGEINEKQIENDRNLKTTSERWQEIGSVMEQAFSKLDTPLGRAGAALAKMVQQVAAAKTTTDKWVAAAQGLAAVWEAAGIGKEQTEGGFGGRGEGNYAAEGAAVGAIIGAIIGTIAYGNTAAGAAIGSAAGEMLGSLIGKGADQAIGVIELKSGELWTNVIQSEHGLGMTITKLGSTIKGALEEILNAIGASILELPNISVKVRDGVIKVVVGEVSGWFKDMGDAVQFAVTEILKQSTLTGVSDTIRQILAKTDAKDLDELGAQLDFGQWYDSLKMGEAGAKIAAGMADFREKWNMAVKFGLDTAPIAEWFARQMTSIKNAMLGINTSAADALAALASWDSGIDSTASQAQAGLDATRAMLDGIMQQIADLAANPPGTGGAKDDISGGYGSGGYDFGGGAETGDDGMGHWVGPTGQSDESAPSSQASEWATMLADLQGKVPELQAAIAAYLAQLDGLPKKLTDEEVNLGIWTAFEKYLSGNKDYAELAHKFAMMRVEAEFEALRLQLVALDKWEEWKDVWQDAHDAAAAGADGGPPKGGGGGKGGEKASDREQVKDMLDASALQIARGKMGTFAAGIADINKKWNDAIPLAHGQANLLAEIEKARRAEMMVMNEQIKARVDSALHPKSQWESQAEEIQKAYDDIRAANEELRKKGIKTDPKWKVDAAERAELAKLGEQAIASFGLPLESAKARVKAMGDTIGFMRQMVDQGAMSTTRFNEVMKQLSGQMETEFLSLAGNIIDTIIEHGKGGTAATAQAEAIKQQLAKATFLMQIAQLNILYNAMGALGDVGVTLQGQLKPILDLVNDPNNWPDWAADPNAGGNNAGDFQGSAGNDYDPIGDAQKLLDLIHDQIRAWTDSDLGPFTQHAKEMNDQLADLTAQAAALHNYDFGGALASAIVELNAAYDIAVDHFVDATIASFDHVPQVVQQARDLRDSLADMAAAFDLLNLTAEQQAEAQAAAAAAVQGFVNDSLRQYERLGRNPLANELEDINTRFDDLRTAFETIGASAEDMARLEQARMAALADFWDRATAGIRGLLDEMRASDPRVSTADRYEQAQARFRDLAARAQSGDLEAVSQLEQAARDYRDAATGYLGFGAGRPRVDDEIMGVLQDVAEMDPVAMRLDTTNELLTQIRDGGGFAGGWESPSWNPDDRGDSPAHGGGGTIAGTRRGGVADRGGYSPASPADGAGFSYGDDTGTRMTLLVAKLDERDRQRAADAEREARARAAIAAAEAGASQDSAQALTLLLEEIKGLRSDIRNAQPPAGR